MALTREELLAAGRRLPFEEHDVPPLGGAVAVQMMRDTDREVYERQLYPMVNGTRALVEQHVRALLIAKCLVGADGARLFTDTPEDLQAISSLRYDVVDLLFAACQRVNGLGAAAVKALESRSAPTQAGDTVSVSPSASV